MQHLAVANPEQIDRIFGESHALWGAGLTLDDYRGMWADVQRTAWGRRWFTYHVWLDDAGTILSSFKLYRPEIRVGDITTRACAIGAVYTPRRHRGRGHARAMLEAVLAEARDRGDALALLFSDIGTPYYEDLGFKVLPSEEAAGTLPRSAPPAPGGYSLRPMRLDDVEAVRNVHDAWCAGRWLAVLRDADHWRFLLERARTFFARLDGSGLEKRYRVVLRDGTFAGYVIGVDGDGEWNLREVGSAAGDPESMAAILRTAAAAARAGGNRRVYGWLPRAFADLVPEWKLRFQPRTRAVAMAKELLQAPLALPYDAAEAAFFPYLDQF